MSDDQSTGYRFESTPTAMGCLLLRIIPHGRRQDFTSKLYVFTPDEVRDLIDALLAGYDGAQW